VTGTFAVSSGERNFTRYGYGVFYRKDSKIDVLYRVWPGTQGHLLWGDPALASGYGRAANFCGAAGMEFCEPLTFKGREGSGHPGERNSYVDSSLANINRDTNRFTITYLLWGRYLYNPDTVPEVHHRFFRQTFGSSGPALEAALASFESYFAPHHDRLAALGFQPQLLAGTLQSHLYSSTYRQAAL
jgi:hypothetical protein